MKPWEVWNEILERRSAQLTPTEQVVNRVNYFLVNFESGDWLYNLSPPAGAGESWSELRATAECVAAVGSPRIARTLRKVVDIVERAKVQQPGTWSEFLARADPSQAIDQMETAISEEISGLWDNLTEYTLTHFECEPD